MSNFWDKIKAVFVKAETKVEDVLTPFEHAFLQKLHPFMRQVETTLGTQGVKLVEDAFAAALPAAVTGNTGAAIAAAAAAVIPEIKADIDADKKNAVYGVLAIAAATVPARLAAPTGTPAPAA